MAVQTAKISLIDFGKEVEYINIDTAKIPYTFNIKLNKTTYTFIIKYNEITDFFTADLSITNTGEVLAYGDPIVAKQQGVEIKIEIAVSVDEINAILADFA